jgi:hypothetical protein
MYLTVGLQKILSLLESEDANVRIHAVKVVANLAAEGQYSFIAGMDELGCGRSEVQTIVLCYSSFYFMQLICVSPCISCRSKSRKDC